MQSYTLTNLLVTIRNDQAKDGQESTFYMTTPPSSFLMYPGLSIKWTGQHLVTDSGNKCAWVIQGSKAVQIHVHNNRRYLYVPRVPGSVKNPHNNNNNMSWFTSYLLNHKQRVNFNNVISDDEIIINGVPWGSNLGPRMFLLFINDLLLYTDPINTDIYADKTTMYEIGISRSEIERNLQIALNNFSKWCKTNGMVINTSKTKLMLITTHLRRATLEFDRLFLTLNEAELTSISKDEILGVTVDNNLLWSNHVNQLCKKIASNGMALIKSKRIARYCSKTSIL